MDKILEEKKLVTLENGANSYLKNNAHYENMYDITQRMNVRDSHTFD